MDYDENHEVINKILNRSTNKKEENISDTYILASNKLREIYGDKTILFLQVGSFFEMYDKYKNKEKREIMGLTLMEEACNLLDLNLMYKTCYPGAGIKPEYSDKYIEQLNDNNYNVVIAVQSKVIGDVVDERKVKCIYSPGVPLISVNDNKLKNEVCRNFISISINTSNDLLNDSVLLQVGISIIDIINGKTYLKQLDNYYENQIDNLKDQILLLITTYKPKELLVIKYSNNDNINYDKLKDLVNKYCINNNIVYYNIESVNETYTNQIKNSKRKIYIKEIIKKFYKNLSSEYIDKYMYNYFEQNVGLDLSFALHSFVFQLEFMSKRNNEFISLLDEPIILNNDNLLIGNHSLEQLNINDTKNYTNVLKIINKCKTNMGKRNFNDLLVNPTTNVNLIQKSLDLTEDFLKEKININNEIIFVYEYIRNELTNILDIQMYSRKINANQITPSKFIDVLNALSNIKLVYQNLQSKNCFNDFLEYFKINKDFTNIIDNIYNYVNNNLDLNIASKIETLNFSSLLKDNNNDIFLLLNIDNEENVLKNNILNILCNEEKINSLRIELIKIILKAEGKTDINNTTINSKYKKYIELKTSQNKNSFNYLSITEKRFKTLEYYLNDKKIKEINVTYKTKITNNEIEQSFKLDLTELKVKKYNNNFGLDHPFIYSLINKNENERITLCNEVLKKYNEFVKRFYNNFVNELKDICKLVTELDILQCKCHIANKYNYCKPIIDNNTSKSYLDIKDLRHVIIETINNDEPYISNNIQLGMDYDGILLYGINTVGKSSLIKSIGIVTIMAQCGLYVPCSSMVFHPYNKIYTRIISNDNLFYGQSTFAVEMMELKLILDNCDENTLVLGDELCSGTEIKSGIPIIITSLETLCENKSSHIFATHFHELSNNKIINSLSNLVKKHLYVEFDKNTNNLIYDRVLKDGSGPDKYGLEVCKSFNLNNKFLNRVNEIRNELYENNTNILECNISKYNSQKIVVPICELCNKNKTDDVHHLIFQKNANNNGFVNLENKMFHKNKTYNLLCVCKECHDNIHRQDKNMISVYTNNGNKLEEIEFQ
jgi:DNA mismatch repair protein MutS